MKILLLKQSQICWNSLRCTAAEVNEQAAKFASYEVNETEEKRGTEVEKEYEKI